MDFDTSAIIPESGASRIIIALDKTTAPKTCHNFLRLINGIQIPDAKSLTYKGTSLSNISQNNFLEGGRIEVNQKKHESLVALKEDHRGISHNIAGVVGVRDDEGSQFYISLNKMTEKNAKYLGFGQVIKGMKAIRKIYKYFQKQKIAA